MCVYSFARPQGGVSFFGSVFIIVKDKLWTKKNKVGTYINVQFQECFLKKKEVWNFNGVSIVGRVQIIFLVGSWAYWKMWLRIICRIFKINNV